MIIHQLTDLSSETQAEIKRRYSSASMIGHAGSLTDHPTPSPCAISPPSIKSVHMAKESLSLKREKLRRDAERISLTRRRSAANSITSNRELKRKELEKLLFEAHCDLDKLIEYTFVSS